MTEVIGNFIAGVGVLVTGGFTYLVYKATKATADATKATLQLSNEIASKEESRRQEYRRIMRRQLLPEISRDSKAAYDAVVDIDAREIYGKLKEAPERLNISKEELAEYFNTHEVNVIKKAWETYEEYRRKYFRNTYSGNEIEILLEKSPKVIENFSELQNMLNTIKV